MLRLHSSTSGFATRELDNLRNTAVNTDIIPDVDDAWDLGSAAKRFAEAHAVKLFAVDNPGGGTITRTGAGLIFGQIKSSTGQLLALAHGALAGGYSTGKGTIGASASGAMGVGYVKGTSTGTAAISANAPGAFAIGRVVTTSSGNSTLLCSAAGSATFGTAKNNTTKNSTIGSTAVACFVGGYFYAQNADANYDVGISGSSRGSFTWGSINCNGKRARIRSTGLGAFSLGNIDIIGGTPALGDILAGSNGSFAQGNIGTAYYGQNQMYIESLGSGTFAQGAIYCTYAAGPYKTKISASNIGTFAQGVCAAGGQTANFGIYATGSGAFAQGAAYAKSITASAKGAFAHGYAKTNAILASAAGAFAVGDSTGGAITASAANSFQFGVGANATANSLQVNADVLLGTAGVTLTDAKNIVVGTTTGTKIGTATSQKLGLWNVAPVIQPAGALQAVITNSTGGAQNGTLVDVTTLGVADPAKCNDNFTDVHALLDAIRTALVNSGVIKGAA